VTQKGESFGTAGVFFETADGVSEDCDEAPRHIPTWAKIQGDGCLARWNEVFYYEDFVDGGQALSLSGAGHIRRFTLYTSFCNRRP